jgi:uncharacterized protein
MTTSRKGIYIFIILTFLLSWGLWITTLALGITPQDGPVFQAAILPGAVAPALAALIVRRWVTREGFTDLGLRPNLRRWPNYLLAWFLPLIIIAVVVLLSYAFNLTLPDYTLQRGYPLLTGQTAPAGTTFLHLLLLTTVATPLAAPFFLGEEFGWRGYLQPRLFNGKPLPAALAVGLIWGVWHLPIHLSGYHLYGNAPTLATIPLLIVYSMLLSIIFGWLQQRTSSVWAPALAHAAANLIGGNLAAVLFAGGPNYLWLAYGGFLSLIPLGLLCVYIWAFGSG